MIVTEKEVVSGTANPKIAAGNRQEMDVAFYLRREFSEDNDIFVFNDLKIIHNGETAQIDHLIIHQRGFLLIESKSIHGKVSINKHGEWARSYRGKWTGIASPLQQVDLQMRLLRTFLSDNRMLFMNKVFGLLQAGVRGRAWDSLCAVSSSAIISRNNLRKEDSERIVKSEFVAETARDVVKTSTSPKFANRELALMVEFLKPSSELDAKERESSRKENFTHDEAKLTKDAIPLSCKKCKEGGNLSSHSGPYGYYVHCHGCNINTPMKRRCYHCNSKNTKVHRQKGVFTLVCKQCNQQGRLDCPTMI